MKLSVYAASALLSFALAYVSVAKTQVGMAPGVEKASAGPSRVLLAAAGPSAPGSAEEPRAVAVEFDPLEESNSTTSVSRAFDPGTAEQKFASEVGRALFTGLLLSTIGQDQQQSFSGQWFQRVFGRAEGPQMLRLPAPQP